MAHVKFMVYIISGVSFDGKNIVTFKVNYFTQLYLYYILKASFSCSFSQASFAFSEYRSGMVNSNTVNSKFHLIRSFFEIFARFLSFHV